MTEETPEQPKKQGVVTPEMYEQMRKSVLDELRPILRKELEDEALTKTGGAGCLPANLNKGEGGSGSDNSGRREFDSYEDMIDTLRKEGDVSTIKKLWAKNIPLILKNSLEYRSKIVVDEAGNVLDSPIKRALKRDNEFIRRGNK